MVRVNPLVAGVVCHWIGGCNVNLMVMRGLQQLERHISEGLKRHREAKSVGLQVYREWYLRGSGQRGRCVYRGEHCACPRRYYGLSSVRPLHFSSWRMDQGKELPGALVEEIGGPDGVMEEHLDYLKKLFTLITLKELKENKELLAEKIVCMFNWANKPDVNRELLEYLPKLKVIASAGAGVDHLDIKMISSYGVKVANTPHAVTNSTADLAMTLLLVAARNFMEAHQIAVSPSTDRFDANWIGGDITGKTLGIVGMGRIGYKIALRAKAFEMKILYHNRHRRPEEEESVRASYCAQLDDLLRQSDYVMLVVNLSPETEKMIGKHEFQMMKPSATLINISRGLVVDQEALVEALQTGRIKGAALDVTYPEPLPRDHPLLKMNNVVLVPHMGTATRDTLRLMMEDMVQSMMDAVNGLPVSNEVTDC